SQNLSTGQATDRAAFVRAAKFYKESQRITPTAGSPRPADFWNYDSGVKVADASPGVRPQDLATLYGVSDDTLGGGPQLVDRNTNPEVAIGVGIGIVSVLGLVLILRVAHV